LFQIRSARHGPTRKRAEAEGQSREDRPMPPLIRFLLWHVALGALVGTAFLYTVLSGASDQTQALLAEAATRPWQIVPIWLGGILPFAIAFAGTALAMSSGKDEGGKREAVRARIDHRRPVQHRRI
jgi:hypothetical protein